MQLSYKVIKRHSFIEDSSQEIGLRSVRFPGNGESFSEHENRQKIEDEARAILKEAQDKAALIIREAEDEKIRVLEEARRQGRREGYTKGLEESEAIKKEARKILEEARKEREELLLNSREELLNLVLQITGAVIQRQVDVNKETVVDIIKIAVEEAIGRTIRIKVAPEELGQARKCREILREELPEEFTITIITDKSLKPGGCIVETEKNLVDASIESRLEQVRAALRGVGIAG